MGYMRAHAIIVDSWKSELLEIAHAKAITLFHGTAEGRMDRVSLVTEITPATINGYRTFLVAPDGSKEGWSESDAGDRARAAFKTWLRAQAYEDGSTALRWVEVMFADDEGLAAVCDHDGNTSLTRRPDEGSRTRVPTKEQIDAAHDAWEEASALWKLRKVNMFGMADDTWLVEPVASDRYEPDAKVSDTYTYHRFEGPDAKQKAQFFLRDKIVAAVLTAALNTKD
jgi:hypothetical protein